jgi:acyl-CoA hydrolase
VRIVTEDKIAEALAARGELGGTLVTDGHASRASQPRIVASGNFATPERLIELADGAIESYRLFILNAQVELADRDGVIFETPFVGPAMRAGGDRLDYLPMRLSLVPQLFVRARPPDIVLVHTSEIRAGKVSLGIEVNILPRAIEQARARGGLVIAQLNPQMPYTLGDAELDCEMIDLALEVDQELASPTARRRNEAAEAIGRNVAALVDDGSTLQLGIGAIPDAALESIAGRRGLAVWTEMISDGVLALERAGATDPARPIVTSFMFGSTELYRWVDGNPRVQMARTETSNDPGMIARQPGMVSINGALQVDLFAQANASRVGSRIYSGFGGQPDFTAGALHSRGGHAVIALPSWHAKSQTSTVVDTIGGQVTSFQHSALVTEQGAAEIFGRSQRAQARLIIDRIAHPSAREQLRESAGRLGLL